MNDHEGSQNGGVTVLGAGIVGICTALFLRQRGVSVRLVDRDPPGEGCSWGNAGVLSSWSCEPMSRPEIWRSIPRWALDPLGPMALKIGYLPRLVPWLLHFARAGRSVKHIRALSDAMFTLNQSTVELYRKLLAGTGHEDLVRDSNYIIVSRRPGTFDLSALGWRLRSDRGAPIEPLSGDEARAIEPALSPEYVCGVRIRSQGRTTNPGRLAKVLAERAMSEGVTFKLATVHAVRPDHDGGVRLETDDGILDANRLVIAAGAWSASLARELGVRIPLEGERGYHMEFAEPGVELNNSVNDYDRQFVASSMEGGVRLAGTSEFNGLDAEPDWRRAELLQKLAKRMLPDLKVDRAKRWMGHRPASPDSVPFIGPIPGHPNVFLACGHGHLGLTGAPMTGQMVAGLMTGERMNVDTTPYRVDRFG